MTNVGPPQNWYVDPAGSGGHRYWDGVRWTEHVAPPPLPYWGPPPWKGAQIGRPAFGPGSLADPGRRFVAVLLDWLVLLPVYAVLLTVTLLIAAPHFGPMFPPVSQNDTTTAPPGAVWLELTIIACTAAMSFVMVAYQTIATATYGRTFGKAWMHIRPVRLDLRPLGWGRAFGRSAIYWISLWFGWLGLLDPLWCLWDDKRQCLHDKVVDSIVIRDLDWPG